jgi:DNA-nicking Smr family endonuclease
MSARGKRGPSQEDHALWTRFTRSVKPLRKVVAPAAQGPETLPHKPQSRLPLRADPIARVAASPPGPPPLAPLDRRTRQRLARGSETIDVRIDLHGMTQREAHAALSAFLQRAQRDGARFALVITGKGIRGGHDGERGVLRRLVPLWLRLPEFRALVIGFEPAHVGHGGEGALYLRLRKPQDSQR